MKNLFLLLSLFTVFNTPVFTPKALALETAIPAQEQIYKNYLTNPGFENFTYGWTASGGATKTANTTAKGEGTYGYDWDSNSASQTLISNSITVPAGLYGKNGYAYCNIKTPSGTSTATMQVDDGTNILSGPALTLTSSSTQFVKHELYFPFPSSGTVRIKFISVASNEPEIYIDSCFLGEANNLTNASGAKVFGAVKWVGTASCQWSKSATSTWASYSADSDCTSPTGSNLIGAATAPATKIPAITFASMPPGDYEITATFQNPTDNNRTCRWAFYDGTTNYTAGTSGGWNGGTLAGAQTVTARITYTTTQSSKTIELRGVGGNSTATCDIAATSSGYEDLDIWVKYYPNQATIAVPSPQVDYDWTAYTPTLSGGGFGTPTSISFYQKRRGSMLEVIGTFTTGTVAASLAPIPLPSGLTIDTTKLSITGNTTAASGVRVGTCTQSGSGGEQATLVTAPGTSTSQVYLGNKSTNANQLIPTNGSTPFASTSVTSCDFKVPITGWVENGRAPTLAGSVTSNALGAYRIETISITNSGTPTISTQSSTWVSSLTDNGAGDTTLNIAAGVFGSTPVCTCTNVIAAATTRLCWVKTTTTPSATAIRVQTVDGSFTGADNDVWVMCMGPR